MGYAEEARQMAEAGREVKSDTFFLAHGSPINTPEDVQVVLDATSVHEFVGASSKMDAVGDLYFYPNGRSTVRYRTKEVQKFIFNVTQ